MIGKLNFIEKYTRAYIAYSMHQCACLSEDPRQSHNKSINNFVRYVVHTKDKGLILEPKYHSFECWAETDFVRNWFKSDAQFSYNAACSSIGFVVTCAGFPIVWALKLQGLISLRNNEVECIALPKDLREVVTIIQLMADICKQGHDIYCKAPCSFCTAFEDNGGTLEISR